MSPEQPKKPSTSSPELEPPAQAPRPQLPRGHALNSREPGKLIGRGHSAGDFLQAYTWDVESESDGQLRVLARLHDGLLNPSGHLFGGFTGTIIDLASLLTVRMPLSEPAHVGWLATVNMRIDYFAPVWGPEFRIVGEITHQRRKTHVTTVEFFDLEGQKLVHSLTTMVERPRT